VRGLCKEGSRGVAMGMVEEGGLVKNEDEDGG
jgi:hypothetical protein